MDTKVDDYIAKQKSPQKEICTVLRKIIFKTFPKIIENLSSGVPCYEGKFYIAALKDHVNLGFAINGLSKDEIKSFEGTGKTMKHLKIFSPDGIDENKINQLLKVVNEKCGGVKF